MEKKAKAAGKYIPWHELLRRTFGDEIVFPKCGGETRLIALVKTGHAIQMILSVMHLQRVFHSPGPSKAFQAPRPAMEEESLEWSAEGEAADWPE